MEIWLQSYFTSKQVGVRLRDLASYRESLTQPGENHIILFITNLLEQFHLTVSATAPVLVLVHGEPGPGHAARVDRLSDRLLAVVERRRRRRGRHDAVALTDGSILDRLTLWKLLI